MNFNNTGKGLYVGNFVYNLLYNWNKNIKNIPIRITSQKYCIRTTIGEKLNDVNSFNNHFNNIKEMIIYFKNKNHETKKRYSKL